MAGFSDRWNSTSSLASCAADLVVANSEAEMLANVALKSAACDMVPSHVEAEDGWGEVQIMFVRFSKNNEVTKSPISPAPISSRAQSSTSMLVT